MNWAVKERALFYTISFAHEFHIKYCIKCCSTEVALETFHEWAGIIFRNPKAGGNTAQQIPTFKLIPKKTFL